MNSIRRSGILFIFIVYTQFYHISFRTKSNETRTNRGRKETLNPDDFFQIRRELRQRRDEESIYIYVVCRCMCTLIRVRATHEYERTQSRCALPKSDQDSGETY